MWESIFLTVVTTAGNYIGKVLQKKGTLILPPLSFKVTVIKAYAFNKLWAIGFLMDIFGAMLMLRALSQAPHGRAIVVSTCAAVASILTGVLAGMLALGERLPSAPAARLWLLLRWVLIIIGVILLVTSARLATYLPWLCRRLVRTSADKNIGL